MRYLAPSLKAPARYPVQGRGLGAEPGDWLAALSQSAMGPMIPAGYTMPGTDWTPWILGGLAGLLVGGVVLWQR
jgi:hypothetical protein